LDLGRLTHSLFPMVGSDRSKNNAAVPRNALNAELSRSASGLYVPEGHTLDMSHPTSENMLF
jgi:hypothetical protein